MFSLGQRAPRTGPKSLAASRRPGKIHLSSKITLPHNSSMFPQAVVTTRVFMPASRVPQFVDAVGSALERYRQRL